MMQSWDDVFSAINDVQLQNESLESRLKRAKKRRTEKRQNLKAVIEGALHEHDVLLLDNDNDDGTHGGAPKFLRTVIQGTPAYQQKIKEVRLSLFQQAKETPMATRLQMTEEERTEWLEASSKDGATRILDSVWSQGGRFLRFTGYDTYGVQVVTQHEARRLVSRDLLLHELSSNHHSKSKTQRKKARRRHRRQQQEKQTAVQQKQKQPKHKASAKKSKKAILPVHQTSSKAPPPVKKTRKPAKKRSQTTKTKNNTPMPQQRQTQSANTNPFDKTEASTIQQHRSVSPFDNPFGASGPFHPVAATTMHNCYYY
jgi:hypothetical protein